jgi:hypothetical protein
MRNEFIFKGFHEKIKNSPGNKPGLKQGETKLALTSPLPCSNEYSIFHKKRRYYI